MEIKDCHRCHISLMVSVMEIQDTSPKSSLEGENDSQFWIPVFLIHKLYSKLNIIYFKSMFPACYILWYKLYEDLILCFRRLWIWERLSLFKKFWQTRRSSGFNPYYHCYTQHRWTETKRETFWEIHMILNKGNYCHWWLY